MVEIGDLARVRLMERRDRRRARIQWIRVGRVGRLGFDVEARVVRLQVAEIVVERSVLLHEDDDVLDLREAGRCGRRCAYDRSEDRENDE